MLHYIGVIIHASLYIFDIGNPVTSGHWIPFTGVIITSLPTCTHKVISAFVTSICISVYVCLYMSLCICISEYVCLYMYTCICMSVYVYLYMYICICISVYVCLYMYICICISVYVCLYMYIFFIYFMHAPLPMQYYILYVKVGIVQFWKQRCVLRNKQMWRVFCFSCFVYLILAAIQYKRSPPRCMIKRTSRDKHKTVHAN
jgi:hypothetical protein